MTEQERLEAAIALAREAHEDQRYGTEPYIQHPLRVMARVSGRAKVVAVLHDVMEDTSTKIPSSLVSETEYVALAALTRAKGETYEQYIKDIAAWEGEAGEIAREVKIADLHDHLAHSPPGGLLLRYQRALAVLGVESTVRVEKAMSDKVQTGVRIDRALLERARKHANERGWTLSAFCENAIASFLRIGLSEDTPPKKPKARLVRTGGKGSKPVATGPLLVKKPDGSIDKLATQRAQRERGR